MRSESHMTQPKGHYYSAQLTSSHGFPTPLRHAMNSQPGSLLCEAAQLPHALCTRM